MICAEKSAPGSITIAGVTPPSIDLPSYCCTCGLLLDEVPYGEGEKKYPFDRSLDCCGRTICGCCVYNNQRFAFYCPYCQTNFPSGSSSSAAPRTSGQTKRAVQSKKEPRGLSISSNEPSTAPHILDSSSLFSSSSPSKQTNASHLPPFPTPGSSSIPSPDGKGCVHHLSPVDTLASLSLLYSVPLPFLRRANRLAPSGADDHLIMAMRTVLIPSATVSQSLSPNPHLSQEQARKQLALRRFMNRTKETSYEMATAYLDECKWDAEAAAKEWEADEAWVRENGGYSEDKMKAMRGRTRTEKEVLGCKEKWNWRGPGEWFCF